MDVKTAYSHLIDSRVYDDRGRFYGVGDGLPLGVGLLYAPIRFPVFSPEERIFLTLEGLVYVLTHECDLDQENDRAFNNSALICPILQLEDLVSEYSEKYGDARTKSFLSALARKEVSRLVYMPPFDDRLPYGGVLNLNEITNTFIDEFGQDGVEKVCSVSAFGIQTIDNFLKNHLLREKSSRLPLQNYTTLSGH
ncbi:hypothetical protein [Marinobacter alexandrii]|jgi:hypothetical protein|uniref:hypothetical protein n=1 Tax=Marinobacter alexandrii TaxID=2570351 RepID=UPI002ABD3341|nr:hypothetical protein [Marinobacter alexandrii]